MNEAPHSEHVLDAEGHFHVEDAPIDLGHYLIEDWASLAFFWLRSEEHTSELQSLRHLVCRLLLSDLNLALHSFPTRRSSDLESMGFSKSDYEKIVAIK